MLILRPKRITYIKREQTSQAQVYYFMNIAGMKKWYAMTPLMPATALGIKHVLADQGSITLVRRVFLSEIIKCVLFST